MKSLFEYMSQASLMHNKDYWKRETKDDMSAMILCFPKASQWGIDNGRISKLEIRNKDKKVVCNYDRGWDVKPTDKKVKDFYDEIIKKYN